MARRRKPKPTESRRAERQRIKDEYAHKQDDARRSGVLGDCPLPPEETLKPERVDPSSQSTQKLPHLIGYAVRRGWATPDDRKPGLVDELVAVVQDPEAKAFDKIAAFGTLARADQIQHERDQEYIRADLVRQMWRGVLEVIRSYVSDTGQLKAMVADVLKLMPAPAAEAVRGQPPAGEVAGADVNQS